MTEMIAKMIAGILGMIKKSEFVKASEELGNVYYDFLKEDAAFFRNIPEDELTHKLLLEHNYTNGHLEILAELFNAEAELCLALGNKSGTIEFSRKALRLFEFIDAEYKIFSQERLDKMESIRARIVD